MTEFSYVVTYLSSSTNITNYVERLEVIETGTEEITSAKIRLNANLGQFVTTSSGGATPIIDEYDKIRVQITDEDSNTYDRIFEVDNIIPVENAGEGTVIDVECLGTEQHLQRLDFAKQYYFASAYEASKDIIDIYNDSDAKGTLQPTIEGHNSATTNTLPKWNANTFDFNLREMKFYDALAFIHKQMGGPVEFFGGGDFWEFYFSKHPTDNNKLIFNSVISGLLPASPITISDTVSINPGETEGGIEATPATIVKAWGADDFGSLPVDFSKFHGELEAFSLHPQYISGVTYPTNAIVQRNGIHYKATASTSTAPPSANWTTITRATVLGSSKYSPWTDGRADEWKSSGSNPEPTVHGAATGFNQRGCWDANLVIQDETYYQTWVHVKSTTDNFSVFWKYGAASGGSYRGLRVLVNGAGINGFAGNDRNGTPYTNNVAQYDGSAWVVIHVTSDSERVAIRGEGKVYQRTAGVWSSIHANARENHCFHIYSSCINSAGINSTDNGAGGTYGDTSAIVYTYSYNPFDVVTSAVLTSENYYKIGAWANVVFPLPDNSYNSNTLGELYGNNVTKKEPATIDTNNMHLTHSGKVGFNNNEAEDYGPLTALRLFTKLRWTDGFGALMLEGDFKMRCFCYDTSDNVVVQDFTISFNDVWQDVSLPLNGFQIYRSRIPKSLPNIVPNFLLNELDVLNVFEWKNLKMIGIQLQEVYDDQGRYSPEGTRILSNVILTALGGNSALELSIDGIHFVKPLLAVTDPVTTRPLMGRPLLQPNISNYVQLKNGARSQLEIDRFRHKQFEVTTEGRINLNFSNRFYLSNTQLVSDSDNGANTIELVAKKIKYTITKPASGPGAFLRTITGVKRLQ